MELDYITICQLIRAHHGGLSEATDAECLSLWRSLPAATRQAYAAQAAAAPQTPCRQGVEITDATLIAGDDDADAT